MKRAMGIRFESEDLQLLCGVLRNLGWKISQKSEDMVDYLDFYRDSAGKITISYSVHYSKNSVRLRENERRTIARMLEVAAIEEDVPLYCGDGENDRMIKLSTVLKILGAED